MKNIIFIIFALLLITSCAQKQVECSNPIKGKAILVAYKVAKHSNMWLLNPATNTVYNINSLGGRREPNIKITDTINVEYCNDEILFDKYQYVRYPENTTSRFIYYKNYSYLYK